MGTPLWGGVPIEFIRKIDYNRAEVMPLKRILSMWMLLVLLCGCTAGAREDVPEFVLTYAENQPAG